MIKFKELEILVSSDKSKTTIKFRATERNGTIWKDTYHWEDQADYKTMINLSIERFERWVNGEITRS